MTSNRTKRHRLGQHFLASPGVLERIVGLIDPLPDDLIIEIGAGKGALTLPLAAKAGKVVAIEKDRAFLPFLEEKAPANLVIVGEDVLKLSFADLASREGAPAGRIKLVGNLPYSISSALLFKIIAERGAFQKCVFLVQKEVAERVCAGPGSKRYAPVSILVQLHFSTTLAFIVRPGSFSPPPRVDSAVIALDRRPAPQFPLSDERKFAGFLQACFRQRRKTLVNNLSAAGVPTARAEELCAKLGLERKIRAEKVTAGQFVKLFDAAEQGGQIRDHRSDPSR
jgi:16S rRNA (adenine1518-N6/adenine1519-N6)-dimethyltransferase